MSTRLNHQLRILLRQLLKAIQQQIVFLLRLRREVFFQQHMNSGKRRRAGERVAAKRGGMQERVVEQHGEDLFRRDRGTNRHHTAAKRFGKTQNVRLHVFMLAGKHLAGTPHTRLHFVEDQQCAKLIAQLTHRRQIARRRQDNPAFALNRLEDHRRHIVASFFAIGKQGAHRVDIPEGHMAETRQQRHKRLTEIRFRGGGKRPERFAVECAAGGDEGEFSTWRLIGFRQL